MRKIALLSLCNEKNSGIQILNSFPKVRLQVSDTQYSKPGS